MFTTRFVQNLRRPFGSAQGRKKRARGRKADLVTEQVKKVLQDTDQKLILMVRG